MHDAISTLLPNIRPDRAENIAIPSIMFDFSFEYCFHFSHCGRHVPLLMKNGSVQFSCALSLWSGMLFIIELLFRLSDAPVSK